MIGIALPRRFALLAGLVAGLSACGTGAENALAVPDPGQPAFAAISFTESVKFPVEVEVFVPCAANGAGEDVLLGGNLHALFHVTEDAAGGFHVKTHVQPQGISGRGSTTGTKYQATGVTQDKLNLTRGVTFTYVNNFRVIGQGRGNNFLIHENLHLTINGTGEMTASVDNFRAECK